MWGDFGTAISCYVYTTMAHFLERCWWQQGSASQNEIKEKLCIVLNSPPQILPLTTVGMRASETQKYNLLCYPNNTLMKWKIDMCLHFASHHKLVRNKVYIFLILALCYLFLTLFNIFCQFLCCVTSNWMMKVNDKSRSSVEEQAVQSQRLPRESEDKYRKHQSGYPAFSLTTENSWPQIWEFWKMS
jgi:hypothetical protein